MERGHRTPAEARLHRARRGESLIDANALGGGHSALGGHLVTRQNPNAPEGDADGYIDPAFFHDLFAGDVTDLILDAAK